MWNLEDDEICLLEFSATFSSASFPSCPVNQALHVFTKKYKKKKKKPKKLHLFFLLHKIYRFIEEKLEHTRKTLL